MARNSITGLQLRSGVWHVDKRIKGYGRLCESCGTSDRDEAERFLIRRMDEIRNALVYNQRPTHIFRDLATRWLTEQMHKPSVELDGWMLKSLDPYIGDLAIDQIHDGTLARYIADRRKKNGRKSETKSGLKLHQKGVSNRTINIALQLVTRILRRAATKWRDEFGKTLLAQPPVITMQDEQAGKRKAYPLAWDEQRVLFKRLPIHLAQMALFKVNTGCREQEVCQLRWDWEVAIPELDATVFLIPYDFGGRNGKGGVKNRSDRLVVLNRVAASVIEAQRGKHKVWVFPFRDKPLTRMNQRSWQEARVVAARDYAAEMQTPANYGYATVRVHDLKHTFGRRLRAAGIDFETRQTLLGHKNDSVTSEYSGAEIGKLIEAANKVLETEKGQTPSITILRRRSA